MFTERFKDKVMVVTGGTSGIGKAVCIRAAGAEGRNSCHRWSK